MALTLIIGNKNYSSWSFRPWIAMTEAGIVFDEIVVPLPETGGRAGEDPILLKHSPSGKVPVLRDGDLTVWESLAIIEHIAETHPEVGLWPSNLAERAIARAVSHEMHGGFSALRSTCHMNIRRSPSKLEVGPDIQADVARIEDIWAMCLERSGGPFLFGRKFSAADAMYAPVVNRFHVYQLTSNPIALGYMETLMARSSWGAWEAASRAETWVLESEEV
ncbi:MAG: glutathione S-transferase family protein [Pseudomonadota bacterium]